MVSDFLMNKTRFLSDIVIIIFMIAWYPISILKMASESTEIISEHLDHVNPTTTQIYLDSFEEKTLKDSAEKALKAVI